jgi:hypothetical protein
LPDKIFSYEKAKEVLSAQGATVWAEAIMWAMQSDIEKARLRLEHSDGPDELLYNQGMLAGMRVMSADILGMFKKEN